MCASVDSTSSHDFSSSIDAAPLCKPWLPSFVVLPGAGSCRPGKEATLAGCAKPNLGCPERSGAVACSGVSGCPMDAALDRAGDSGP